MPIAPWQFLETARRLLANPENEADLRTAVSRCYYSVFLRFYEEGSQFQITPSVLTVSIGRPIKHDKFIRALIECPNVNVKLVGERLQVLYRARIVADYQNHRTVSATNTNAMYANAAALHAEIEKVGLAVFGKELEIHLRQKYASYLPPSS